jgi:citrate lyase beta subunit
MLSALSLGATLYMPATRPDLWSVVKGEKYPKLRSVVICLEDAVADHEVELALANLRTLLLHLQNESVLSQSPFVFVRPRDINMAAELGQWSSIALIDGMILPKFGIDNLLQWNRILPHGLHLMPTLETPDTFDMVAIRELRLALLQDFRPVLALRIGGNDLMSCLGLRRPVTQTIYQTPLGPLIASLCGQFLPYGFSLSAPVFEHFSKTQLLQEELAIDIQHGLCGKTIIHPLQIDIVHQAYQVDHAEFMEAEQILATNAKAVFECHGSMLEPATHRRWAERIVQRAEAFGLQSPESHSCSSPNQ